MRSKLLSLLILLSSAIVINDVRKQSAKKRAITRRPYEARQNGVADSCNNPTNGCIQGTNVKREPHTEQDWRELQKRYWKRQQDLAKWLNVITAVVGFIAIGSLYFLYVQTNAAKNTAQIALDQLRISQRPWIGITETAVLDPLTFGTNASEIRVRFMVVNSGASIANKVHKMVNVLFTRQFNDVIASEKSICNVAPPPPTLAHLILPGQTKNLTTQFRNVSPQITVNAQSMTQMWIAGCIFYWDQLDRRHRTPLLYLLQTKSGSTFQATGKVDGDLVSFPTVTVAD